MRIIIVIYFQIAYFSKVLSYDQLIKHGFTVANSSSVGWGGFPNKTVDGNYSQDNYAYCMHTANGHKEAWLRIDLGGVYNLKSVKIWYRNDRESGNTERLKGFSVRLSNLREPVPTEICYQDPGNETLPVILEKNCTGVARYIWFYTRRDNGAFLEICEVEAYGCPRKKHGENCVSCDTCKQDCDITGRCDRFGCLHDGYASPYCKECQEGFYGGNCTPCGHCAKNKPCDQVNGSCPGGHCEPGWKHLNKRCDQECDDGTFGFYCVAKCSGHCLGGLSCNKADGICIGGCEDGWMDDNCNKTCSPGTYGKSCKETCGHCKSNTPCHHINGSCRAICEPGYHGEKCLKTCSPGTYGESCKETCGHCKSKVPCHHINGSCRALCEPGYHGEKCLTTCSPGTYGESCKETCGHCKSKMPCHHINGSCRALCEPGYLGKKCVTTCSPGTYGESCKETCGHCKSKMPCHHINGSCRALCEPGYHGEKCVTNQLVRRGYTKASGSSVAYGGDPRKTVDGDFRQSSYTYCMHTAGREPEAWLRIDLRKIYHINSVKFWYRNDSRIRGYNTRKIQGFNIRLSNTTETDHQDICYQNDGNKILPPIIEQGCTGVAQYVWIYTNKTFKDGVFLEICEVQIFGCSYQDSDGNCISCNQCKNDCNINGECDDQGCEKDGYRPPYCKECRSGKYGKDCNSSCGRCANNGVCSNVTGSCPVESCAPGWKHTVDWKCNQACSHGRFGKNCGEECGHCANNGTCDHVNGICPGLCEPGYKRKRCKNECKPGLYGQNCSFSCGHCATNAICNHVNGACPSGHCEPGWKDTPGKRCDQGCDAGTYGLYCKHNCSGHCAGGLPCNKADGVCLRGCADGWKNPRCNEKCDEGFYGRNCSLPCGHCAKNATCDHVNGSCPSGYCKPGWKHTIYKRCDQECDDGTYGLYCDHNCSVHCAGELLCNKANGVCLGGCADGWIKPNCDETCSPGRYGKDCKEECGHCEGNEPCHHVHGSCPALCEPGYHGEKCITVCTNGWYGKECEEQCGYCRGNKPCHHVNGSCFGFCEPEYSGEKCKDSVSSQVSQVLANQIKMLKLMRELISFKRQKVDLKENGASPTDFK